LADFAKLIDLFDQHNVSFVSVTQQFNTTTSMGRLTLNVLISFAQFEREVTSERIGTTLRRQAAMMRHYCDRMGANPFDGGEPGWMWIEINCPLEPKGLRRRTRANPSRIATSRCRTASPILCDSAAYSTAVSASGASLKSTNRGGVLSDRGISTFE
jgi:hypothetical protein